MKNKLNEWDFETKVRKNKLTGQTYITIPFVLRSKFKKNKLYRVTLKEVDE